MQHASRPQHADDVSFFRIAKADLEVGRVLPEISIRTGDLKLLPVPAGKHFHLRSDGALVVCQSLEREAQPVILIAAFIAQQHGWTVILRDQQIGRAIAIVVAGNDGARLFELNLVEANVGGYILETIRAEIAEQPHFALAIFRFADGDQIDPAVVVVIDGGDAEGTDPVCRRQVDAIESLAVVVAPQSNAGLAICVKASPSSRHGRNRAPRRHW